MKFNEDVRRLFFHLATSSNENFVLSNTCKVFTGLRLYWAFILCFPTRSVYMDQQRGTYQLRDSGQR